MSRSRWLAGAAIVAIAFPGLAACAGSSVGSAPETPAPDVAAKIGDRTITLGEVDESALSKNLQQFQALYDARRQVLEGMIAEILIEREATERGITPAELASAEIDQKVQEVTDEEVKTFFDQNRNRMGNRPLDQMTPAIRDFLVNRQRLETREAFLTELKQKNGVRILLEPPRVHVEVAENDPSRGPAAAAIEIIEFSDFE